MAVADDVDGHGPGVSHALAGLVGAGDITLELSC
jgi:hypothetical protein